MKFSLAALRAEWNRANLSMRYFLATHMFANFLMASLSITSMVLGAMGQKERQILLLAGAALCGAQALLTWTVLQRRFKIRYSLW